MKRSRKIALLVMGVNSLALVACSDPKVDSEIYASVEQCIKQSPMSDEECKANFAAAQKSHQKVAPKFKSQADCEAEFGKERCEPSRSYSQSNGSSFFMPMMMGYMMSRMMSGGGMGSQPLYRGRNDPNFRTGDNKNVGARTGRVGVARSAAKAPRAKYEARAPHRRYATTQKRSGGTTGSRTSLRSTRPGLSRNRSFSARSRSSSGGRFGGK